ncbi:unnamed protein product [[Candida] boidinii]|nr:unnamed protein product [[Candida] boidinii]
MHMKALRVSKQEDMVGAVTEMINYNDGPILLEVMVEKKVPVLPMVPAGKALHEFILFDPEVEKEQSDLRHKRTNGKH